MKMQDICAAMLPALVVGFATLPVQSQNLANLEECDECSGAPDKGGNFMIKRKMPPPGFASASAWMNLPPPPGLISPDGPVGPRGAMGMGAGGPMTMGFAMMPPIGGPGGAGPGAGLPLTMLDLSDDQMEKIGELRADIQDKSGPILIKLQSLQREFRGGLAQANINTAELKRINSEISAQKQALDSLRSQEMISTAELLTKEQRQEMKQTMNRAEFGAGFGKRQIAR